MNIEKMKEAFADEAFLQHLFELDTVEEVQAALKEKDVELTEEEILSVRELLIKVESGEISVEQIEQWAAQMNDGEISDEMLEQVSGGSVTFTAVMIILGACGAIAVFFLGKCVDGLVYSFTRRHW